ncbi:adenylosuccinate lyase [Cellulophaga sp. F20128]|uniref:adenylosuccinate lyase n=1 Tax=Cellulophaga sp. F20128 TaxID=2926413 RepID=UPI001FF63547|nr:adenylosuccinate lyase [Cellulophaga sp. F20128]MCK0157699.1 adenylosuccinate lyase [Cellulophaga sp. F20128]
MTKSALYERLVSGVNHSREKRQEISDLILDQPLLMPLLLELVFKVKDPISCKAAWVMEFTVKQDITILFPVLNDFTKGLHTLTLESSIRPNAKICEILILQYYAKQENIIQSVVKKQHLEDITTACFDWLIGDHKVAAQAYSMTSLLLLGRTFPWIHPELRIILEQNYATGTAAYKARARMTLAKL